MNARLLADVFLEQIKGQEMYPAVRNTTLLGSANNWATKKYFGPHYKDQTPLPCIVLIKEVESFAFFPADKLRNIAVEIFEQYWKKPEILQERIKEFEMLAKEVDILYSKMSYEHVAKASPASLSKDIERMNDAYWAANAVMWSTIHFDKEFCQELIRRLKIPIMRLDAVWERAIIPVTESFEKRRLLYFLELMKSKVPWNQIVELCQYFMTGYDKVFPLGEVEEHLKSFAASTPEDASKLLEKELQEKRKLLGKYDQWLSGLSEAEQKLARYIQHIIEFRDRRKDVIGKGLTAINRAAERMLKDAGVPEEYVKYCRPQEISEDYLKMHKPEILRRKNGYVVLTSYEGQIQEEYGLFEENKQRLEQAYLEQEKSKIGSELKGQTGSPGKTRGTVKVVTNIALEGKNFKDGDILVTGMTRPEFVPLMKKAGAIITDEGGITSHAAIVSRELKKPCVIGTKIATKVLKDGDMVEVDADKGVVRKVK